MPNNINWTAVIIVAIAVTLFFLYSFLVRILPPCNTGPEGVPENLQQFGAIAQDCYDERKENTGYMLEETYVVGVSKLHSGYHAVKLFVEGLRKQDASELIQDHCVILYVDPVEMECKPLGTLIAKDCNPYTFEEFLNNEKIARMKIPFYKDYEIEIETYN